MAISWKRKAHPFALGVWRQDRRLQIHHHRGISMRKPSVLKVTLSSFLLTACAVVSADGVSNPDNELPRIRVPNGTTLELNTLSCTSSVLEFQGRVELHGRLDVYWYEHVIDSESPTEVLTETQLGLDFFPTADSQKKLPSVFIAGEGSWPNMKIRLNNLNHRRAEALLLMFGFQEAKKMLRLKQSQSFTGLLRLGTFSTYFECNTRHFDGEPVSFKASSGPIAIQQPPAPRGCS